MTATTIAAIELEDRYGAPNYHSLPAVIATAEGAWVTDIDGKRYLDMLSAYSALNFGHRHPALVNAAVEQLGRMSLISRAVHSDLFGPFVSELAELCGMEMVLPMNSGAEGVETALKAARKWGYDVKGIAEDRAKIVVCERNFHGRTTTIVSFSTEESSRAGFGPFTPGFVTIPFGDADALEAAIDQDTVAFLVEPVQGEAGVIVPPEGYLRSVRQICTRNNVLLIADEIQTGFGRTGETFACQREDVTPDVYILGKALGGGIVALSAVVSSAEILGVMTPGTHGSTFGGNPLALAVGREVMRLVRTGEYQERSRVLGARLLERLRSAASPHVSEVRGVGLWAGIELTPDVGPARGVCEELLARGVICKDTHMTTIRLAPPLMIDEHDLDWAVDEVVDALGALGG
ncbi:MAG: ornithine--oxo-acid transaminase [Coriobacteriales bacterium]|nr:ornithine--oxo-acid transaminase [Coriobacteriales bacterium]